ncbi:MAG TPA: deaminase, partial [Glaciihabitans sp.]|nr:deaminase [Glaciihabitans sp.]
MANLVCSGLMSLDGFVADDSGNFDWAAPSEEVHGFINELESRVGTYLLGRKTYEVLSVWDTFDTPDQPQVIHDFAKVWRAA